MFIRVGAAQSGLHPSYLGFVFFVGFVLFCSNAVFQLVGST